VNTALQAAFVLHRRNYRDTSQIIELFTASAGRISVVAKGAKRRKSPLHTSLQMFQPLLVSWQGKHELQTLVHAELQQPFAMVSGKYLAWAFYLNELLFRLLQKHEPYPFLFDHYQRLLQQITQQDVTEKALRYFELDLLQRMGYALNLTHDDHNAPLETSCYYHCQPGQNPLKIQYKAESRQHYSGAMLLALAEQNLNGEQLKQAKHLLRQALASLLGDKPLKSRELVQ
jgi:DNA repair protein RecO (recombination protein O)